MHASLEIATAALVAVGFAATATAQITEFRNGQVADANAVNRNFVTVNGTATSALAAANQAGAAADAAQGAATAAQQAADTARAAADQARAAADQASSRVGQLQGRVDPLLAVLSRQGSELRFTALPELTRGAEFPTGANLRFGDVNENTDAIFFRRVTFNRANSNVSGLDLIIGDDPNSGSVNDFFRIGTAAPDGSGYQDRFFFRSDGLAGKPGGGSWAAVSDRRTKRDIEPLEGSLDRLLALRGTTFFYSEPEKYGGTADQQIGFVAQEVEEVFPQWVHDFHDGTKCLSITGFEALTVESLREVVARNQALEQQNEELRARLDRIERQLGIRGDDGGR